MINGFNIHKDVENPWFSPGKQSTNGVFSTSMLVYKRVTMAKSPISRDIPCLQAGIKSDSMANHYMGYNGI